MAPLPPGPGVSDGDLWVYDGVWQWWGWGSRAVGVDVVGQGAHGRAPSGADERGTVAQCHTGMRGETLASAATYLRAQVRRRIDDTHRNIGPESSHHHD